jgi:hypothetical protein
MLLLVLFLPMVGLAQNSNPCDDGDPNTIDVMDGEGNCIHIAKVCNDGAGTTITLTIPAGPECKDIPCDDGDPKTVDIVDINGECHHIQLGCDDGDPTTLDYVDENGQCVNEKIVCDDGDPETEDYLDENGVCHHVKIINNCNTCENDQTPPTADCRKELTVKLGDGGMVEIWPSEIDKGSFDECSDVSLSIDKSKFGCDDLGYQYVTLTVKDEAGNKAYCKTKVKVTDPENKCYDPCEDDNTKPSAKCKEWIIVPLGDGGMVEIWASELDNGSYDDCSEVTLSIDKSKFDCDDIGMNKVMLTVKDKAGNTATCKTLVEITDPYKYCQDPCDKDKTKPIAKCVEWVEVKIGKDKYVKVQPQQVDNGSYDECSEVYLSLDKYKFDCDDIGMHTVTLTVKDKAGNKAYCKSQVKVTDPYKYCQDPCDNDKTKPIAKCVEWVEVKIGKDKYVKVQPQQVDNGSYDECSDVWLSLDKNKFDCDDIGMHTVTLTVKDKAGNKAYCKSQVKVTDPYKYCQDPCDDDNTKPTPKCVEWVEVKIGKDKIVKVQPQQVDDGSYDECSDVWLSLDKYKFDCDDIGMHTVTLTVKDKAGNKAYCKSQVKVTDPYKYCQDPCDDDNTKPTPKCVEWVEVKIGKDKIVKVQPQQVDDGSYDECSDVWLSLDKYKFDCDDIGMHTVTLTVKDKAGNKAYCKSQVKVTDPYKYCQDPCDDDHTKPTPKCVEWVEVKIGEDGIAKVSPEKVDDGSYDECSEVWLSLDKYKFDCDDIGMHTVTLTVKDKAGNKAYCKSQVKVTDPHKYCEDPCKYDKEAPEAKCKPVVNAKIGKDQVVYIDPADVDRGSKDDCSEVWLSLSQNKFTCDDLGWNRVTLTVKDKAGNTDKCYSYVKVLDPHKYCEDPCKDDNEAPDAKCKEEITVELGRDGYKDITVFDINNGSKDDCSEVWLSIDKTRFSCEDLGYQKVTMTVRDKAGNKSYCNTKVKVTDPKGVCSINTCEPDKEAPEAKCKDVIVELNRNKQVSITAQDLDGGSYDQCGEVRLYIDKNRFNCKDLGVQYVELTVRDKSGNTAKCTSKVSVTDPEDYCGMKLNDCDPEELEDCEISMVWYTCTTLKICIGKHDLSNIIVDRDKKGYQDEDIDVKFDELEGLTFYYDAEKYGMPKGFWIKSANKCGKCDDDDDDDGDWYGDRCPPNQGAGKYYEIPERPDDCPDWSVIFGPNTGFETGGYYNTTLQQSSNQSEQNIRSFEAQEYVGPSNFESVNIYPNPSSNKVFVAFDGFKQNDLQVLIYNAMGEQLRILKTQPAKEPQDLGVDDMPSGLYYLRVVKPNGEFIAKEFIIKK